MTRQGTRALKLAKPKGLDIRPRRRATTPVWLRLPKDLHKKWFKASLADGFGERGNSRWLEEALMDLSKFDRLLRQSISGEDDQDNDTKTVVRLSHDAYETLVDMRRDVLSTTEDDQGVRAMILRCAIRHRLANPSRFPSSGGIGLSTG